MKWGLYLPPLAEPGGAVLPYLLAQACPGGAAVLLAVPAEPQHLADIGGAVLLYLLAQVRPWGTTEPVIVQTLLLPAS